MENPVVWGKREGRDFARDNGNGILSCPSLGIFLLLQKSKLLFCVSKSVEAVAKKVQTVLLRPFICGQKNHQKRVKPFWVAIPAPSTVVK